MKHGRVLRRAAIVGSIVGGLYLIGRLITGEWADFSEAGLPFVMLAIALAAAMANLDRKKEE